MFDKYEIMEMDAGTMRGVIMNLQDKIRELEEVERLRHIGTDDLSERAREALNQ